MSRTLMPDSQPTEIDEEIKPTDHAILHSLLNAPKRPDVSNHGIERDYEPAGTSYQDVLPVHINEPARPVEPDETDIRILAHSLWEQRDPSHGSSEDDWFQARRQLQESARQQP